MALLVVAALTTSCDSSQDTGPYDCSKGSIPEDALCFDFEGEKQPFRFKDVGIVGTWSSHEFETCIAYAEDGTATFRYWGIFGGVPRDDSSVRWGIWLDVNGKPILSGDGLPIVVHHLEEGPVLDRRLLGIGYSEDAGLAGDFKRVESCPENTESDQGAITFFTTNRDTDAITVALDSYVVGELAEVVSGDDPDCGAPTASSVLTLYRQPGTYSFQALSTVAVWGPSLIEVKARECGLHALR